MEKRLISKSSSGLFKVDNNTVFMKISTSAQTPSGGKAGNCQRMPEISQRRGFDWNGREYKRPDPLQNASHGLQADISYPGPGSSHRNGEPSNATIVSTGGISLKGHASYVGSIALSTLSAFHFDKSFLSTSAFDPTLGLCDYSEELSNKQTY